MNGRLVSDTMVIAERSLIRPTRSPDLLLGYTVQPIMFVLLFVYVFGGAIATPGFDDYATFMIPGILVGNMAFGGFTTALALAEDMGKGLIDRFRSLPMHPASVLAGRTIADLVTNLFGVAIVVVTGLLIGFSFDTTLAEALAGVGLLLLFGFAWSWVFALLGMLVSTPEAANGIGFTLVLPLTFLSSVYVPADTMPAGLQWFAEINPITVIAEAMRALWLGSPAENYVWGSVVWSLVMIAIFAPLAVRKYRRATTR